MPSKDRVTCVHLYICFLHFLLYLINSMFDTQISEDKSQIADGTSRDDKQQRLPCQIFSNQFSLDHWQEKIPEATNQPKGTVDRLQICLKTDQYLIMLSVHV